MQKTKSSSLGGFVLMSVLFFFAVPSMAQERQDFPNDDRTQYEANQSPDSHGNINRDREIHRDSLVIKPLIVTPTTKPKVNDGKSKKEEEPLSYNFLYYIIQKFKGSDVVD